MIGRGLIGLLGLLGLLGLVATAWAALTVTLPVRVKAKATLVVNELGQVLFGSVPGRVEVTNFPASPGGGGVRVVRDATGTLIGRVHREISTSPFYAVSPGITVVRDIDGLQIEIGVSQYGFFSLSYYGSSIVYDAPACGGTGFINPNPNPDFFPPTTVVGNTLFFPLNTTEQTITEHSASFVLPDVASCESVGVVLHAGPPVVCCQTFGGGSTLRRFGPLGQLDLSQFTRPFRIEVE